MSAELHRLSGLHGANLAAFHRATAIVDANIRRAPLFDTRAESIMRGVRDLLGYAVNAARIDEETAQSFVARAGNKLSLAMHMQEFKR